MYMRKVWVIDVHYQKDIHFEEINGNYEDSYRMLLLYGLEYEKANVGRKVVVVQLC